MFTMENEYVLAAFLHPNYKQLRGATDSQAASCHAFCRSSVTPQSSHGEPVAQDDDEQINGGGKRLIVQLMDKKKKKKNTTSSDEIEQYIEFSLDNQQYQNPMIFWTNKVHQKLFPNLFNLACQYFAIPCSSASVERQFSAAGQIINQRRSSLNPSTVNNILFLRSTTKNDFFN